MTNELRNNILTLISKVREVLNNNDWPTEEGERRADEDEPCYIEQLCNAIREEL